MVLSSEGAWRHCQVMCIKAIALFVLLTVAEAAAPARPLSVRIELADGAHVFDSVRGKVLGDYIGPDFVQQNIEARDPKIPFTVYFRPDRAGERREVVFEWGDVLKGIPRHLGAYTATISEGGKEIARVDVSAHYWLSRWRWQSTPRPVVRTAAELIAARLVPPYAAIATVPHPAGAPPYTVMDLSDVTSYMPTTGDRSDIGLMPERYAAFLATGDTALQASIFAWAEASSTIPWHVRDTATHAPLSYDAYPEASTYENQKGSKPTLSLLPTQRVAIDGAHQPALAYLPFLLTGDPYYLEELQFAATFTLGNYPHHGGIIRHDQTREFAWTLRTMFYTASATPEQVPSWLLPKAYWQDKLVRNRLWIMRNYVDNPSTKTATFSSGVDALRMPCWQEDFLAAVLGLGVWMGYTDWEPVSAWKIKNTIARANGTSGWPRAHPTCYYAELEQGGAKANNWHDLAVLNKLNPSENESLDPKTDGSSSAFARAALALGVANNVAEAAEPYQWLDGEIRKKYIPWRWAIAPPAP
ncbi:MAG: hypothetical protein KBA31_13400 [Alphaproteobacteria bacterium]|nr:hypothetical protein [Alphaproteobacteria bacterium]